MYVVVFVDQVFKGEGRMAGRFWKRFDAADVMMKNYLEQVTAQTRRDCIPLCHDE